MTVWTGGRVTLSAFPLPSMVVTYPLSLSVSRSRRPISHSLLCLDFGLQGRGFGHPELISICPWCHPSAPSVAVLWLLEVSVLPPFISLASTSAPLGDNHQPLLPVPSHRGPSTPTWQKSSWENACLLKQSPWDFVSCW